MAINRGLGKGLSALFSDTDAEYENSSYQKEEEKLNNIRAEEKKEGATNNIAVEKIYANPAQPRKTFETGALNDLSQSIAKHGILQPLILCEKHGKYMIIAGERRFRAAKLAGFDTVPAIVKNYTDREIKEISLIENLQREDLNAVEAATALKQLMDEFNLTQDELSRQIGKSRPAIANLVRLLSLPSKVLDMVKDKKLSEGHARCLIGLDSDTALMLAERAESKGFSVRDTERAVKELQEKPAVTTKKQYDGEPHSRELKDLISDMQRVFGTKVTAVGTDTKGRIYIDYYSPDDLDRIFYITEKLKK